MICNKRNMGIRWDAGYDRINDTIGQAGAFRSEINRNIEDIRFETLRGRLRAMENNGVITSEVIGMCRFYRQAPDNRARVAVLRTIARAEEARRGQE